MTKPALWYQGARPKTLGAAISPVLVGTAAGSLDGAINWPRAVAAGVVAVALQIGVNFANDYSDGVRGTDAERRGPVRLTATGLASPARGDATRRSISFAVAAVVGGDPFAGRQSVAVARRRRCDHRRGHLHRRAEAVRLHRSRRGHGARVLRLRRDGRQRVRAARVAARCRVGGARSRPGYPACGILLANNVRDVDTDRVTGKRTLAVRIGAPRARGLYVACVAGSMVAVVACGAFVPERRCSRFWRCRSRSRRCGRC